MSLTKYLAPLCLLSACSAPPMLPPVIGAMPPSVALQQRSTAPERGIVRSDYRYSSDRSELTIIMEHDNGETQENLLVQRGGSVTVETVIKRSGSVQRRHRTRADEAQLAIKVAANNGWRDVHSDLRSRYQQAGLL